MLQEMYLLPTNSVIIIILYTNLNTLIVFKVRIEECRLQEPINLKFNTVNVKPGPFFVQQADFLSPPPAALCWSGHSSHQGRFHRGYQTWPCYLCRESKDNTQ